MAVLLILLGIAVFGVLADFVIENDIATAATQPFVQFRTTFELSTPALVAIAFGLGVLAMLLVFAGVRRARRGRRRLLQQRIEDLKDQNERLAVKRNLETVIRIPEAEPAEPAQPAELAQPAEPPPPPVAVIEEDKPASMW